MPRVYSILLSLLEVSSSFVLQVLSVLESIGGLNTRSTWSMSGTCARVQAVLAVQTSKILGVLRVSRVLNPEILQAFE